jgi:polar amino acid transport system substrate-binding protein
MATFTLLHHPGRFSVGLLSFAMLCVGGASAASTATQPITVAWRDKPPYHYIENGENKGFLLKRTRAVFKQAGVPARFVNEPQKRIWANLSHGATNYCAISWYRLPDREAVAQFTLPIHEDMPHTILIAPGALESVKAHPTLASLLDDPSLTLGVVEGASYGPLIDQMIRNSKNQLMSRTVEVTLMMRMLAIGRASFMFVDREDWEFFRKKEIGVQAATRHDFPDMPPGLRRYIACSKDVTPEIIDKLNHAITVTGGTYNAGHSIKK